MWLGTYSVLVIQNLEIFPLFDSRVLNPPIGTLELPVQNNRKLLRSFWVKFDNTSQKLIITLSYSK